MAFDKPTHGRSWRYHPAVRTGELLVAMCMVGVACYLMVEYISSPGPNRASVGGARALSSSVSEQKVIERGDKRLLWGGSNADQHFDITEFRLNPDQLNYGLGRENFLIPVAPKFDPAGERELSPDTRVLAVAIGQQVHVYPLRQMRRHEVVNDEINGEAFFVGYCPLAELGAVYNRQYGEHTLTFAVSGYTYADSELWDGRNAFVLWDRDTESLWLPTMGKAVSGPLIHTPLQTLEQDKWSQTTWQQVRKTYPLEQIEILSRDQPRPDPTRWENQQTRLAELETADQIDIAPRWGENDRMSDSGTQNADNSSD
jgi:hypothetical protein